MDPFEKPLESHPIAGAGDAWQSEHVQLQRLFNWTLATLLVFAASLNLYLFFQTSIVRKELDNARPQVNQMRADFEKNEAQLYQAFFYNLNVFARSNPDLTPILMKYAILAPASTTQAPSAPAPSTASKPK